MKKAFQYLLLVLLNLALVEGVLRLQQLVPVFDLSAKNMRPINSLSERFNHVHAEGLSEHFELKGEENYGEHAGFKYQFRCNEDGLRVYEGQETIPNPQSKTLKVLFMGDSFTEGYDDKNTLPQLVKERLAGRGIKIQALNAGTTSMSPSLEIPYAKYLIPKYRPDLVVFMVDETDLGDDWLRYKKLTVRDTSGRIERVLPTPLNQTFSEGLRRSLSHPLYIVRLFKKLYFLNVYFPAYQKGYESDRWLMTHVLDPSRDISPGAAVKYAQPIREFEANLREMASEAARLVGKERVVFFKHPHLQHLQADAEGRKWNRFVSEAVAKIGSEQGIATHDATGFMEEKFAGQAAQYYWNGDMHFNFKGMAVYADFMADRIGEIMVNAKW